MLQPVGAAAIARVCAWMEGEGGAEESSSWFHTYVCVLWVPQSSENSHPDAPLTFAPELDKRRRIPPLGKQAHP